MTVFREQFDASFVVLFGTLLFLKVFHWLSADRVEYVSCAPPPLLLGCLPCPLALFSHRQHPVPGTDGAITLCIAPLSYSDVRDAVDAALA